MQNWGCRATSAALIGLLEEEFNIRYSITKIQVHKKSPLYPKMVSESLWKFGFKSKADTLVNKGYFAYPLLGISKNYLTDDVQLSIQNFRKHIQTTPFFQEIDNKIKDTDLIVINGEGSVILLPEIREDFLFQAFIIELATQYYQKPVYYLNSMVSEAPDATVSSYSRDFFAAHFAKCRLLSCRDPQSESLARQYIPDLPIIYLPDALFSWYEYYENKPGLSENGDYILPWSAEMERHWYGKIDLSQKYICIGGSSLAPTQSSVNLVESYIQLVKKLSGLKTRILLVETCSGDAFLRDVALAMDTPIIPVETPIYAAGRILAGAQVLISGRYHPSILASLRGTPCIFLSSNSHKTRSLQRVLNYETVLEFGFPPSYSEISEIYQLVAKYISFSDSCRKKITFTARQNSQVVRHLPNILLNDFFTQV